MKIRGIEIKDMYAYIQGNIRYELFYSRVRWLIPKHIKEQIIYRINSMEIVCYDNGSCKMCGCKTTALQMANKACDKPCYPKMLTRTDWKFAKDCNIVPRAYIYGTWLLDTKNLKFIKI